LSSQWLSSSAVIASALIKAIITQDAIADDHLYI
jgi:hypothetical protein